jgi:hypothetical protein
MTLVLLKGLIHKKNHLLLYSNKVQYEIQPQRNNRRN